MSIVANPFVVLLDANVLFPFRVRDVLLTFAHEGLFRARFTDDILDEWTRNLIRLKPHLETSVRQQEAMIREVFDECFGPVTGRSSPASIFLIPRIVMFWPLRSGLRRRSSSRRTGAISPPPSWTNTGSRRSERMTCWSVPTSCSRLRLRGRCPGSERDIGPRR